MAPKYKEINLKKRLKLLIMVPSSIIKSYNSIQNFLIAIYVFATVSSQLIFDSEKIGKF